VPTTSSFNGPRPAENPQTTNPQTEQMPPPKPSAIRESLGSLSQRPLPQPPASISVISSTNSISLPPGASSHSRSTSISTTSGQTHVPSGTLSAFRRRPSVSNTQQGGNTGFSGSGSRFQLDQLNPSTTLERSSIANTATSSSTNTSLRSFTMKTPGMTEAQAQAARSRAKWAAEEQGLTTSQSASTPPLPRSPPLTPPTSPPRSLNADEAGRVRRDGVEKMRREAERRREEDEKRRVAEQQRQAEIEEQQRLDKEREAREVRDRAAREEKRKATELQKKAMEEELGKQRAEERIRVRERFGEVKDTDEVFLTGHVNIQAQNTMVSVTSSSRFGYILTSLIDLAKEILRIDCRWLFTALQVVRCARPRQAPGYDYR
jgi:hypothetical protein